MEEGKSEAFDIQMNQRNGIRLVVSIDYIVRIPSDAHVYFDQ